MTVEKRKKVVNQGPTKVGNITVGKVIENFLGEPLSVAEKRIKKQNKILEQRISKRDKKRKKVIDTVVDLTKDKSERKKPAKKTVLNAMIVIEMIAAFSSTSFNTELPFEIQQLILEKIKNKLKLGNLENIEIGPMGGIHNRKKKMTKRRMAIKKDYLLQSVKWLLFIVKQTKLFQ